MSRIRLVISDCDGTLVTPDKQLTPATRAAVARLHAAGVGFTVTSSRPSFGMRMLIAPLGITLPIGGFNGSSIVLPDMTPLAQHAIPRDAAQQSIDLLARAGVDIWVFTADAWVISNRKGVYVAHEEDTIQSAPTVVSDFAPYLDRACKIVGASKDPDKLARCEADMQQALGQTAHAARSQSYYLDVTPPGQDKGNFVDAMAARLSVAKHEIATLGDMRNDVPMFKRSGVSFAMGNAPDAVKAEASHVTASNTDDGFAKAIDLILEMT
jgi:Cof subfamily protein (haloacid dehalogenase superfamily)